MILLLPPAVSANLYWRTRVFGKRAMTYVSAEAKEFRAVVGARAKQFGLTSPMEGRVTVTIEMYPHRPLDWEKRVKKHGWNWDDTVRSIDLDNAIKVTLDAMKGVVIVDDVWVREIVARRMQPDEHGARLVVQVEKMGGM